jgi:hypothetical protein
MLLLSSYKITTGRNKMTNNNSIYHALNGNYVIVGTQVGNYWGRLEQDTHDTLSLRPSIVNEPSFRITDDGTKSTPRFRIEDDLPTLVNTIVVQTIQPTTEKYFRSIANGGERK